MAKKITILGTNVLKVQTGNAVSNRFEYICANPEITSGNLEAPSSLDDCYAFFPEILNIAKALGVGNSYSVPAFFGISGASSGIFPCGLSGSSGISGGVSGGMPLIFKEPDKECLKIEDLLGKEWMGCFWPDPLANFSCGCPIYGDMYENYLKYRLGSATFWNTPLQVPIWRQEFIESVKSLIEITVTGSLSYRPGDIVYIKIDNLTGLASGDPEMEMDKSVRTGFYYIMRAKNVIKNDGGHTTILSLTRFTEENFYPDVVVSAE